MLVSPDRKNEVLITSHCSKLIGLKLVLVSITLPDERDFLKIKKNKTVMILKILIKSESAFAYETKI